MNLRALVLVSTLFFTLVFYQNCSESFKAKTINVEIDSGATLRSNLPVLGSGSGGTLTSENAGFANALNMTPTPTPAAGGGAIPTPTPTTSGAGATPTPTPASGGAGVSSNTSLPPVVGSPTVLTGDIDLIIGSTAQLNALKAKIAPGVAMFCTSGVIYSINDIPTDNLRLSWMDYYGMSCGQTLEFANYITIDSELKIQGNLRVTGTLVITERGRLLIEGGRLDLGDPAGSIPGAIFIAKGGQLYLQSTNATVGSSTDKPYGMIWLEGEFRYGMPTSFTFSIQPNPNTANILLDARMGLSADLLTIGGSLNGNTSIDGNLTTTPGGGLPFTPMITKCADKPDACN